MKNSKLFILPLVVAVIPGCIDRSYGIDPDDTYICQNDDDCLAGYKCIDELFEGSKTCAPSCQNDAGCDANRYCKNGGCYIRHELGAVCVYNNECFSEICHNAVCSTHCQNDDDCDGDCNFCDTNSRFCEPREKFSGNGMCSGLRFQCDGAGQCECSTNFAGTNCNECKNSLMTGTNCNECKNSLMTGTNCNECKNSLMTGTNCNECKNSLMTGPNCNECKNSLMTGTNCNECKNSLMTGTNCNECKNSLMTGTNCDQCNGGYGKNCQAYGSVTDQDGNTYKTVIIGNQEWMAENYRRKTGTYYYPDNNSSNTNTYGLLYPWATASAANFCPSGWRLPTKTDFDNLLTYVGKNRTASSDFLALIKKSTDWTSYSNKGLDEFGFSALPAGYYYSGNYSDFGLGVWWSATEYGSSDAYYLHLGDGYASVDDNNDKTYGFSVRCLRDSN